MRIALYTSGAEGFPLVRMLKQQFFHELTVFLDRNAWPVEDKGAGFRRERLEACMEALTTEGTQSPDYIIVPPMVELDMLNNASSTPIPVLPLFSTYLIQHACKHSLVGKFGILAEPVDGATCQATIRTFLTKTSDKNRAYRVKQVPQRKYALTHLSTKDRMIRKTIKTDLRYFKDAAVDTLIPTSRGQFAYQSMITHMVSRKRMRFHGLDALGQAFQNCTKDLHSQNSSHPIVHLMTNGDADMLLCQKRWSNILETSS